MRLAKMLLTSDIFCKPNIYVSWSTSELKVEVGALLNRFKPSSKIFYWPFQGGASFVDSLCFSVLCLLCFCARLFICAMWSPAGKGLTSWLSFAVSNCEFVNFPLVSWVTCGTWLYRFLIFAPLLTLIQTVWHYDGFPEIIFRKSWFWIPQRSQNTQHVKSSESMEAKKGLDKNIIMWHLAPPTG